uniref:EGF-like domain-containing protein n=1 Tax=Magallana gigas TaxID=29159 RepID=A0A8W8LWR0_MAGGI
MTNRKFYYKDVVSFVRSDQSCGFLPSDLPHIIQKHHSVEKESCLVFLTNVTDKSSRSMFIEFDTKYFAFGAKYSFDTKIGACYETSLQKVEGLLICEGPTDVNGTTCDQGCNRGNEVCRSAMGDNQEFCVSERTYKESCDDNLPCSRNLECKASGDKKTCQCKQDYEAIEGRCLKGQLPLGEICEYDSQCMGNLSQCLQDELKGRRVCSCLKGYIAIGNQCYKSGLVLHENCRGDLQCTGTENAERCNTVEHHAQRTCTCNDDYIDIGSKCYKKNRRLYESCERSEQCTAYGGASECKDIDGVKICHCREDSRVFNGVCLKSELSLDEPCYIDGQCLGARNATVCGGKHNGSTSLTCQCNTGFLRYRKGCLQENKHLFEECEIDDQCNGTSLVCREIRNRKLCLCKEGFKADVEHLECFKALKTGASGRNYQSVLTAVCGVLGFVCIIACSVVIRFVLRRREQATKRIDENQKTSDSSSIEIHNSPAENSTKNVDQETKKKNFKIFEPTEDVYNEADPVEEIDSQHVYNISNHHPTFILIIYLGYQILDRKFGKSTISGRLILWTYHYQDFTAFVRSEERCGFYPENVSSFIRRGPTVLSGSRCNQGCNRLSEVCRRSSDVNEEFCISERKIDDFYDNNLLCPRNSECRMVNNFTSCQCLEDYEALDGRCKKVGLTLGDTCDYNSQCSGTINASLCLHDRIRNKKVCSCVNGYVAGASNCILGRSGCPRGPWLTSKRLQVDKQLYEECEKDDQCNATSEKEVCREIRGRKLCLCEVGFIEDTTALKCLQVNNLQFTGQEIIQPLHNEFAHRCRKNAIHTLLTLTLNGHPFLSSDIQAIRPYEYWSTQLYDLEY